MFPLLLLIILIPFISILPLIAAKEKILHSISILTSALTFVLTILTLYLAYSNYNLNISVSYINYLGLSFGLVGGQINLILLLMTATVFLAASMVGAFSIGVGERKYNIIFAIAEGASLAVFISSSFFFLFVFWEISEVMMFFIIYLYGGYDRRYAAFKFILYSLVSSLLLLIGMMVLYTSITPHTFDIQTLIANGSAIPASSQLLVLALFMVSFMIKMPIFPFHSWLPDAHTEAPTTGSMILAGVLLKFGGYGLILAFLILPIAAHYAIYIAMVFAFSSIYAALVALRQTNLKRAIAYTSITDMGIVAIGAAASNSLGIAGALYFMLSHALAISILFLISGTLDELYGTLEINKIKGVLKNFPSISYLFILGVMAAIGLPLTSGFIADLLTFTGAFEAFRVVGLLPFAGVFLMGALLFWLYERIFQGEKYTKPYKGLASSVIYSGTFLMIMSIILGVLPFLLLNLK